MQELDGKDLGGSRLEVSLAKPPSDKKKKEEILRARERRMMQMIHGRSGLVLAGVLACERERIWRNWGSFTKKQLLNWVRTILVKVVRTTVLRV